MNYSLAYGLGSDAGNKNMVNNHRLRWDRDDFNAAMAEANRLVDNLEDGGPDMIKMTYDMAHRAGLDAGDRSMRAAGRTVWNEEDLAAASAETNRLIDQIEGPHPAKTPEGHHEEG